MTATHTDGRSDLQLPASPSEVAPASVASGVDLLTREELSQLFAGFVRLRLYILPFPLAIVGWTVLYEPSLWRKVVVGCLATLMGTVSVLEAVRFRRYGLTGRIFALNIALPILAACVMILAAGGLEGPVYPVLVPLTLMFCVLVKSRRSRLFILALHVAWVWTLALLAVSGRIPDLIPQAFGGGSRVGHSNVLLYSSATAMTLFFNLAYQIGSRGRAAYDGILRRAVLARDVALETYADQARLLTTMAGEIAHELKNPLSSVKGLGALIAKDVEALGDGARKSAERLAVLRREVDRMQAILEGFLNFSRPLGPLAESEVDLTALCREVAGLCEGLIDDKAVTLEIRSQALGAVCCDARKIQQVVLNLLQNAIEASPRRGAIVVEVTSESDGGARVAVLDRGTGLAPAVDGRAFEAGVTTKAKGSGLGLTIARALVLQHGGDLTLEPRDGGGCRAELRLPRLAPVVRAAEATT